MNQSSVSMVVAFLFEEKPKPLRVFENAIEDSAEPKAIHERTEASESQKPADSSLTAKILGGIATAKNPIKKPKRTREGEQKAKKEITWSRPTAISNTRIPPELRTRLETRCLARLECSPKVDARVMKVYRQVGWSSVSAAGDQRADSLPLAQPVRRHEGRRSFWRMRNSIRRFGRKPCGETLSPTWKRKAVVHVQHSKQISERWACSVLG